MILEKHPFKSPNSTEVTTAVLPSLQEQYSHIVSFLRAQHTKELMMIFLEDIGRGWSGLIRPVSSFIAWGDCTPRVNFGFISPVGWFFSHFLVASCSISIFFLSTRHPTIVLQGLHSDICPSHVEESSKCGDLTCSTLFRAKEQQAPWPPYPMYPGFLSSNHQMKFFCRVENLSQFCANFASAVKFFFFFWILH